MTTRTEGGARPEEGRTMICDWCHADTLRTYRVTDAHGTEEQVCVNCRHDLTYCEACGQVPQDPGDQP